MQKLCAFFARQIHTLKSQIASKTSIVLETIYAYPNTLNYFSDDDATYALKPIPVRTRNEYTEHFETTHKFREF